jgi:hypothetical protein
MRPLLARFSEPVWSGHAPSLAVALTKKIRQDLVRKLHLPELIIADWSAQFGL